MESGVQVTFRVHFASVPGQELYLCGSSDKLGNDSIESARKLTYTPNWWELVSPGLTPGAQLQYRYYMKDAGSGKITWERGKPRTVAVPKTGITKLICEDGPFRKKPSVEEEIFHTTAFRDVIYGRVTQVDASETQQDLSNTKSKVSESEKAAGDYLIFQTLQVRVAPTEEVYIRFRTKDITATGARNAGSENAQRAESTIERRLSADRFPYWTLWMPLAELGLDQSQEQLIHYQLLIRSGKQGSIVASDEGLSRALRIPVSGYSVQHSDYKAITDPEKTARFAGLAIPVFSIRSNNSCGVGELLDLERMIDLAVLMKLSLIQLLPLNDTSVTGTWRDSYPYSCLSVHALHPLYLNLDELSPPSGLAKEIQQARARLNQLSAIDYEAVMNTKMGFLRRLYAQDKQRILRDPVFLKFFNENQEWLVPYAVSRFLAKVNGTADFAQWGSRHHVSMTDLETIAAPETFYFDELALHYYVQFHLYRQLARVGEYAAKNRVILKGDLPIGVHRYSVDAWMNQDQFFLDRQTGAPPDQFAEFGQNWGFPTYNWERMASDNYRWWRGRLRSMQKVFHAYRIDHILGFFRIWEIPGNAVSGLRGRFRPVNPIKREELDSRGIWDIERLCEPYISETQLRRVFGDQKWTFVRDFFLQPWYNRYRFREIYDSEIKLQAFFADEAQARRFCEQSGIDQEYLRLELFRFQNDVILLRDFDHPEEAFHPRIEFWRAPTYWELNGDWQHKLRQLYDDYFFRRQEALWRDKAMEKLPMLKAATDMLVCGEDLGMLPSCVFEVLENLCIIGLRVQRMPENAEFGDCSKYPYLTVATTGSHDTSTLRGWWEEIPAEKRQRFWCDVMKRDGKAPTDCTPETVEWMIRDHLQAPSILTIFPLQDLLGMDAKLRRPVATEEQINVPANPDHYWRFRLHLSVEELLQKREWIRKFASMVSESKRNRID
jgi:4-alpha-glucanotransferase